MANTRYAKHKVLPWPAVPIPTPDEVYAGLTDQAKEYPLSLEKQLRQSENFKKPENLTTVRVLDLSKGMIIGNWCSSMLSELGSDTIKCEPPDGDPLRWQTPFGRKEYMIKDAETGEPIGLHFLNEMRNKQSITLNLEKPEGRELLKKLAVHVDVLIENYPPGQFDAWGIGYRQLKEINPRLVYCWVGQKGQWGPSKDKPGNLDPTAQASCGFVHGTGLPKEFGGRRFYELALARNLVAIEERGEDPYGRRGPADLVRHPHGRAGGPSAEFLREAGAVDESAGRLSGRIQVARLVFGRPPLAFLPHPAVDEPRVDLLQLPIADSPRIELSRRVVLDQDVDMDGELLEELAV